MKKPEHIGFILDKALKDLEIDPPLKTYSVVTAWRKIVGENISSQSQPCFIRNKILFVKVSHSTWIQQLQFLKPKLLEKIREFLGESLIEDIRFRLGKIDQLNSCDEKPYSKEDQELDRETLERIEGLLKTIGDEDIKRLLRNIFINVAKLKFHKRL